ncbi:uncharacterized protein C5orf34 homolog [Myripristis murdjan]|uniref:Zgc:153352 n=1 Tax=Myripristis murdjan TaxID=586833 RepID=A0A667WK08_9TELE|nr:uncharacterized protein C5orf34 homolog [Myripristis murdjan]
MAVSASVSLMIIYEDEAVDVHYADGSRLQLSPCGSEFMLLKAPDPSGHPLQGAQTVRQRTRFTISTYKELLIAALVFRNKYATRPYLPEELIPADHRKPFFSIDSDVEWPEPSSCHAEFGPGGETIISSVEGRATLTLSSSGEDFSVELGCSLSRPGSQHQREPGHVGQPDGRAVSQRDKAGCLQATDDETSEVQRRRTRNKEPIRARSCSPQMNGHGPAQSKPEDIYQSTTVVQHHSCCDVAPLWRYPLSLALHHWSHRLSKPLADIGAEGATDCSQAHRRINMTDVPSEERKSHLPEALPLSCPSPHQHRWKFKDPLAKSEEPLDQDLPRELVKVMWCQGVTYRILNEAISVIEVSPGDGSVIRSNGALNSYFTHHKRELCAGQVKEVTYHLNSLPPDVPGQLYSVASIMKRASRILTCYNQARLSLKLPVTPSCLQQDRHFSVPVISNENPRSSPPLDHQVSQTAQSRANLVAVELEKIKRFNFLLEHSSLLKSEMRSPELGCRSTEGESRGEAVNESCIADALQRTSKAIQDIDALLSATTLT